MSLSPARRIDSAPPFSWTGASPKVVKSNSSGSIQPCCCDDFSRGKGCHPHPHGDPRLVHQSLMSGLSSGTPSKSDVGCSGGSGTACCPNQWQILRGLNTNLESVASEAAAALADSQFTVGIVGRMEVARLVQRRCLLGTEVQVGCAQVGF
jgi:hypothetical protein